MAVIDVFLAWLLMRAGVSSWILLWVAISGVLQVGRVLYVQRLVVARPVPKPTDMRRVYLWFFVLGVVRAWPIVVGFQTGNTEVHFLVTLVTIGSAAGGLGSAAGLVKAYAAWVVPLGVVQVGAWLTRNTFEGRWIAILLTLLLALLVLNVRSYGQTLRQLGEEVDRVNAERLRAEAERQRAEVERRRADEERQRAEVAVLAKTRFFAAASHDLRQPLGVLRWYGDAVRLHADQLGHAPLQAIGEGIGRALEHAEPLVRKYLDIAKIEAGALELTPRSLKVSPLFAQLREDFGRDAELGSLTIDVQLGSQPGSLVVNTDESLLRSILDNLVGNAIKFTPPGGRITLGAHAVEAEGRRFVRLSVRDTGIGIALADQSRVFEDFYQVGNPERSRSKGMGLGLAIVRRQTSLLGSAIRLVSSQGEGATFEFDLPAGRTESDATSSPTFAPSSMAKAATKSGSLRVLVIDDEPDIRQALRLMLEAANWQVRGAAGSEQARLMLLDDARVDALVVDYRVSDEESGIDVIQALREAGCVAPAVVVTGDTSPDKLRLLAETGLPVLHKPVTGEVLVTTIIDLLAQEG
ncbi:ATP-binding response regulator [Roseateles sp. P5_E8]